MNDHSVLNHVAGHYLPGFPGLLCHLEYKIGDGLFYCEGGRVLSNLFLILHKNPLVW